MRYKDREGNLKGENGFQDKLLKSLYGSTVGRAVVKCLTVPFVSELGGKILDSSLSRLFITPFVKMNHIDLSLCEKKEFDSYNAFFKRKFKEDAREINMAEDVFISPCDAKLTVYPIKTGSRFSIKHTAYTVEELLKNKKLADRYEGGYAWIFRLSVEDYHRYCYVADGRKSKNIRIKGVFHTVNPVANDVHPIYKENAREYSLLKTEKFGTVLMMEVGALLVGKIENRHEERKVKRGEEKGNFAFGGSTIILLTQKDKVCVDKDILKNTECAYETLVKMGEKIGERKNV